MRVHKAPIRAAFLFSGGEVQHTFQALLRAGFWFLAVQRDDGGEDVGNLLQGVKLALLLARQAANWPIRYS